MKTKDIQESLCKEEVLKGNLPCENISLGMFNSEIDVLSILKSGYIVEYEVKISRSDFKADAKKSKWEWWDLKIENRMPNYFYYVCTDDLIKVDEIQDFAGLIYINENSYRVIKKAKILHRFKHDILKILTKFCRVKSERKYLGNCLMTYKNNIIKKRNIARMSEQKAQGLLLFLLIHIVMPSF